MFNRWVPNVDNTIVESLRAYYRSVAGVDPEIFNSDVESRYILFGAVHDYIMVMNTRNGKYMTKSLVKNAGPKPISTNRQTAMLDIKANNSRLEVARRKRTIDILNELKNVYNENIIHVLINFLCDVSAIRTSGKDSQQKEE